MAFNERNISGNMGTYPGVGNPAAHSSAVDPSKTSASATQERSARGDRDARRAMRRYSGVVEGHPGIIESTHIEPLDEDYKEDEGGRGRTMEQSMPMQAQSLKERATTAAEGTANIVYGIVTGDQKTMQTGKEALGLDK